MTTAINGTSIQAAIDKAGPGETFNIAAGLYKGFRAGKPVHLRGDGVVVEGTFVTDAAKPGNVLTLASAARGSTVVGDFTVRGAVRKFGTNLLVETADDVTLDGVKVEEGEAGYGIRVWESDRTTIRNFAARKVAVAVQFHGKAAGALLEDFSMTDVDRMINDDPTPGNDYGANGVDLSRCLGPLLIRRGKMTNIRSAHSYDYTRDGGAFSVWGGAKNVTIEDIEIRNALNVLEDGRASGQPDNANFTLRRVKAYGEPVPILGHWYDVPKDRGCQGLLLRAMVDFRMEDCDLTDLDGWTFFFNKSGNFEGGLDRIVLVGNRIALKAGDNRAYVYTAGVPLGAVTLANAVSIAEGNEAVVYVEGHGAGSSDLAAFRSWGARAEGETWAPLAPPEPPDPCAAITAELAAANAALDVALTRNAALETALAAAGSERARLAGIIARALEVLADQP